MSTYVFVWIEKWISLRSVTNSRFDCQISFLRRCQFAREHPKTVSGLCREKGLRDRRGWKGSSNSNNQRPDRTGKTWSGIEISVSTDTGSAADKECTLLWGIGKGIRRLPSVYLQRKNGKDFDGKIIHVNPPRTVNRIQQKQQIEVHTIKKTTEKNGVYCDLIEMASIYFFQFTPCSGGRSVCWEGPSPQSSPSLSFRIYFPENITCKMQSTTVLSRLVLGAFPSTHY